ncbi:MAG: hypothetical protein M0R46_17425 [Candidatus Muirbacterium halophilum]|nr:hypothetical protein [Candidatus Muirbacterium halophilum]
MKIRNGFVSNSSSSSFVIALPKDFDAVAYVEEKYSEMRSYLVSDIIDKWEDEFDGMDEEKFVKEKSVQIIENLKSEGYYDSYESSLEMYVIGELLRDYIIVSMESGPDSGYCELLSEKQIDKIKNILKIK